jgi:site-specific DNA-cytosine methylase
MENKGNPMRPMKILIACEFSGIVREAFDAKGHDVWSCDLLPTEIPGKHIQEDILKHLEIHAKIYEDWDLMIAHPPCTYLAVSGARWFKDRIQEQQEALNFVKALMNAPAKRICIENPVSIISTRIRKPDQIIQPWMFGHGETKKTCLWLKNLPLLKPTNIVEGRENRIHKMAPSKNRSKERSRTYQGIADAMANQWGNSELLETK